MHQITVQSIGIGGFIEWTETVTAKSKSAATRKANSIVCSCGVDDIAIEKQTNRLDDSLETWRLT